MSDQQWTPRIRRIDNEGQERLQYVRSLIQEKRVDEARDELLSILEQNDKLGRAHLMLGSLYQGQGLLGEGLEHFKYAIAIDPMDAQAHLRAGICSLRMNRLEDARGLLKTALDLDPKLVAGRVALAQALSRLGETETAIEHVEQALRLDPQLASARQLLAQLLAKSGRPKEAIEELDGFVAANPDNARAAVSLARLQGQQGEAKKAIELLETAAKATPESDNVWSTLGRMKLAAKDYEGAEKAFTELLRVRPESRFAPLQLVSALIPQGKFDQARDILKPLPRRGRMASLVHQYYGDMHVAQKRYDEAVQSYRAAILLSEGGEKTLGDIEVAMGQIKDNREIATLLQTALAKKRDEARSELGQRRRSGEAGGRGPMQPGGRRLRGAGQFRGPSQLAS
jgi:tetratricopeptide (TPR) repeat protein